MNQETGQGEPVASRVVKKRIVPFEEETPVQQPLFINYAQVAHAGGAAYIDVGVIDVDEILSLSGPITFLVQSRLVMSLETLKGLGLQIAQIVAADENKTDSASK